MKLMETKLQIFKSVFRGRDDAFAIRWEKDSKAGYTPAYDLDWNAFKIHKEKGGTLKDFPNKKHAPLTDSRLINHLSGKEVIGLYPLLQDNTSWFIAADFDEAASKSWLTECREFIAECEKNNLPVYLERSRSGAGGHVWLFFQDTYPANKSRQIFKHLLAACGVIVNKTSSFDRLFPNQDYLSGKELGNLIALPLQKAALEKQNACFIDPLTEMPFPDQWHFLEQIQKISVRSLDELYKRLFGKRGENKISNTALNQSCKLHIQLDKHITISRQNLPNLLYRYLRDSLNFLNTEYFIKKNSGRNTFDTDKYFKSLNEEGDSLIIPRGFAGNLLRYCRKQNIDYVLDDKRTKHETINYHFSASLYPYQQAAVDSTSKKDFGIIVSPPGSGKTIMGLAIIAAKQQPALILVHRKQLFDQWIERIVAFLGIPSFRIGKVEGGRFDIGDEITVAMIQSLQSEKVPANLYQSFSTIIVDECHHISAKTFRQVIGNFHTFYLYGFTATPIRKNNDEKLIFIHISEIIHEVVVPANQQGNRPLNLIIQNTEFLLPFNSQIDKVETLMHVLIHDTARNEIVVSDIKREVIAGRKVLVLTERKTHIEILHQYLKVACEVIILTGDDSEEKRKGKFIQIENEEFQVILATGQFFGEGMDIHSINCLVLAYPFSFEGKLIQYIGRVQRSVLTPVIYDYRDGKVEYLSNLFRERKKYYRQLLKNNKLSRFDELVLVFKEKMFYINETDQLLEINCIDLPLPVEHFIDNIAWKIRVIDYNEEQGNLFAEIIDYDFPISQSRKAGQETFYFYGVERIRFKNIDTNGFMKAVVLANKAIEGASVYPKEIQQSTKTSEHVLLKVMKVPLWKISFLPGAVSFPIYIEELEKEISFEIANPDIRPEFEAIRDYFSKALKKKLITTEIAIRHDSKKLITANAKSVDIDSINNSMIDSMRFQFVRREILKTPPETAKQLHTLDELPASKSVKKLYQTDLELIDEILAIKKSKHYLQVKYLATKHEASILKVRFVLQPFSFLFLLAGEKGYHIAWETLDTEEATYLWSTDKTREALKKLITQIETDISEIQNTGRQSYIDKERNNFTRIMHDYADLKKGFVIWKGMLEQIIS